MHLFIKKWEKVLKNEINLYIKEKVINLYKIKYFNFSMLDYWENRWKKVIHFWEILWKKIMRKFLSCTKKLIILQNKQLNYDANIASEVKELISTLKWPYSAQKMKQILERFLRLMRQNTSIYN